MLIKTNDCNLINELDNKCFEAKESYSIELLETMLKNNEFYLINKNDINVGFIILQKIDPDYELIKIGILEQYRKNNIAYETIKYILEHYEYEYFYLEVNSKNQAAINLYLKLGFEIYNYRKQYYSDSSDAILMRFKND